MATLVEVKEKRKRKLSAVAAEAAKNAQAAEAVKAAIKAKVAKADSKKAKTTAKTKAPKPASEEGAPLHLMFQPRSPLAVLNSRTIVRLGCRQRFQADNSAHAEGAREGVPQRRQ